MTEFLIPPVMLTMVWLVCRQVIRVMDRLERTWPGAIDPGPVTWVMRHIARMDQERLERERGPVWPDQERMDEWDALFLRETGKHVDEPPARRWVDGDAITGELWNAYRAQVQGGAQVIQEGPEYQTCDCELCADDGRQVRRNHVVPVDPDRPGVW